MTTFLVILELVALCGFVVFVSVLWELEDQHTAKFHERLEQIYKDWN